MSEYVLRTVGETRIDVPPFDVMEVDERGMGRSVAWFWYEHEAREYMNWKACKDSKEDEVKHEMTPKEQELWEALKFLAMQVETFNTSQECETEATRLLTKARECYADCPKCARKDEALKAALEFDRYTDSEALVKQIKEALK